MKTLGLTLLVAASLGNPAHPADIERPPINYGSAAPRDVITELQQRMAKGSVTLDRDEERGYLASLLKELDVPVSSQVLVFSKTSLQRQRIGPKTPRAIYFNDDVTVGYCQRGDVLEVAAADPDLGTVFYTLAQNPEKRRSFVRQQDACLICHGSSTNQGFPGHLVRSVAVDRGGEMVLSQGSRRVDHSTPFAERWGGWYVTGRAGKQSHQGNQIVGGWPGEHKDADHANVTDLKPFFTVGNYLSPHSDLVALMVLEHQGEAHNRLTRANYLTRLALAEQADLNKALGRPDDERSEGITRRINHACEAVVQYLLFGGESPLKGEVSGSSDFAREFAARGPFDSKGRSLREFDLKTRMFKYPLSYVVYSRPFDGLPAEAKERVYRRLWEVLTERDQSPEFEHLSQDDRKAAFEILKETKKGLPEYWFK